MHVLTPEDAAMLVECIMRALNSHARHRLCDIPFMHLSYYWRLLSNMRALLLPV
jgi:hypothetical protein